MVPTVVLMIPCELCDFCIFYLLYHLVDLPDIPMEISSKDRAGLAAVFIVCPVGIVIKSRKRIFIDPLI